MNCKLIVSFVLFLIFVVPAFARTTCTPSACPVVNYNGKQMSTNWESDTLKNSYDGGSCSAGGDYCIRSCTSANGCYGSVTDEDSGYQTYSDYCWKNNWVTGYGVDSTGANSHCYAIRSKVIFDGDDYNDINLRYEGLHQFYTNYIARQTLATLSNTGTRAISSTKWIYVMPGSVWSNKPSGYDYYTYTSGNSYTFGTIAKYLDAISGCSNSQVFAEADQDVYSIPYASGMTANSSCLQNSPPTTAITADTVSTNPVQLNASNVNTLVSIKKSPATNYFDVHWVDDGEDDGIWNGQIYLYYGTTTPNILASSWDFSNIGLSCSPTATNCTLDFWLFWDTSSLPDGIYKIKIVVRDKWYPTHAEASVTWNQVKFYSVVNPTVVLNAPANDITVTTGSYINFNYTSTSAINTSVFNELIINGVPYFSGYESNGTPHNHSYQFNTAGVYTWKVQVTDAYGNAVSETRNFTVISPSYPTISSYSVTNPVNVNSPLQCNATVVVGTYPIASVNCTLSPAGVTIPMSLSGGIYTGSTTAQSAWATNQNYNITACDNHGFCSSVVGTTQINHYPSVSSVSVNPTSPITYSPSGTITFSSSWDEDIGLSTCTFYLDSNSYAATKVGNSCSYSIVGLSAGSHSYWWSATDIGGLSNQSSTYSYTVNKATPVISHSISPSNSVPYGTSVSGSCSVSNNTGSSMTYNRCTLQSSASQATPGTLTFGPVTPSTGTYICNCSVASSANWNYAENIITLSVGSSTPPSLSNLIPTNNAVVNSGTPTLFLTNAVAGSFPVSIVYAYIYEPGVGYRVYAQSMNFYTGNQYYTTITLSESWGNYLRYATAAGDTMNVWGWSNNFPYTNTIINNHPPLYTNITVSPPMPVQYSPSRVYSFNITWYDDLFSVTSVNITLDGVTHAATNVGGNVWQYNVTGLSYGQHNYTWAAVDSYGARRTTPLQTYSVGTTQPIFMINITPSISVISGTQTNVSCTVDVNVIPQLWRNGVSVSNPDVQTLPVGQYLYLCNFTPTGNYSYSYTTDLLIVNPANSQTQTQFCDGQLDKTYTYTNGGENYTMCVNIPCGSNVSSATLNLTGLSLSKLLNWTIGFFRPSSGAIINCYSSPAYYYHTYCYNTAFYMNGGKLELVNSRIYNSTFNNTILNYPVTIANLYIKDAYFLNGKLIYGTVTPLTNVDYDTGLYNIMFDT